VKDGTACRFLERQRGGGSRQGARAHLSSFETLHCGVSLLDAATDGLANAEIQALNAGQTWLVTFGLAEEPRRNDAIRQVQALHEGVKKLGAG